MENDKLLTVRERLERLKNNPKKVPKPLDMMPEKRAPEPVPEATLNFEKEFQQKAEKAIKNIESVKNKMKGSKSFINYFYDLKKVEKEFLNILQEAEEKHIEFPENFLKKIESVKSTIRSKI